MDTRVLYGILERRFSLGELHSLAFDCGWDKETIGTSHTVKAAFLRELIQFASRHSALNRLMKMAANANPVLKFDGTRLVELNGESFEPTQVSVAAPPPDPRLERKQQIMEGLERRDNRAVFEALAYLLEVAN